jgi:hypothetical protein
MSASEKGQVTRNAAEVYEEFFLPALFQQWASRVADAAGIQPGQQVLKVDLHPCERSRGLLTSSKPRWIRYRERESNMSVRTGVNHHHHKFCKMAP